MSKTLGRVRARAHVMHVDDERADGSPIIIVLCEGFDFADDPGCGVRGVDTVAQAESVTRRCNVVEAKK